MIRRGLGQARLRTPLALWLHNGGYVTLTGKARGAGMLLRVASPPTSGTRHTYRMLGQRRTPYL